MAATDNADFPDYAPQPNHNWSPINGGSGYGLWTPLADTGGGGTYMEGVGVNGRQVEGNYSFGLYAGGGSFDISRPLISPLATGEFDIITRFDVAGAGPNIVSLRYGNQTTGIGAGQLLSFGIINGNQLSFTDADGFQVLPSGEARRSVWGWKVDFDTVTGNYSCYVANLGGGFEAKITGQLESTGQPVGSFAVINSSTGNNQQVIFDTPTFYSTPEPATLSLLALGGLALLQQRLHLLHQVRHVQRFAQAGAGAAA
jgi:hypothetical protein